MADELVAADAVVPDAIACADEPIRVPGSIQPHGFLLGIDPETEAVVFASENVEHFLRVPVRLIVGARLELFLEREVLASVRGLKMMADPMGLLTYLGAFQIGGELFSLLAHCVDKVRVLEFERQDRLVGTEMMNSVMTNFVALLGRLESEEAVCRAITEQIADLTGFDRVLLYSFDDAGHGTVLAEANKGKLRSYLGLRFPATDIPVQARALYIQNTVRIIPDAGYTPVPLKGLPDGNVGATDMSLCVLRSVSPVHLEYMRNMGTLSSMSVSIVSEGRLWGLISGHHAQPHLVPFLLRSACDLLSKMVATQLAALATGTRLRTMVKLHDVQRRVLTQIASENDYLGFMATQLPSLLAVTDADGVAVMLEPGLESAGLTPPTGFLRELVEWLNAQPAFEVLQTNHLGSLAPFAQEHAATASGLLAIRISDVRRRYVLWFRQEVVQTVKWAGEPVKTVDAGRHLHPRHSFASWQETLRAQSVPWSAAEIESAREFRAALNTISLRRAEEEAELSAARFNKLTHTLPIKIFAVSDDGLLSYTNARWQEEGLGTQGLWYGEGRLDADDAARCADAWARGVREESEVEVEVRFMLRGAANQQARENWHLVNIVPFRRKGANRAGWIGSCIDLTERRQREATLRITDKLEQTSRMTSYFAHEINNPLEALTNLTFLLRTRLEHDAEALGYIGMLNHEFERIGSTVKQTLRWTAENSDKKSRATAGEIFEDVSRLYAAKIRNRDVQVIVGEGEGLAVYGIIGQIRQVVAHLLSNAIDAVPVGGSVTMWAQGDAAGVALIVEDRGKGMSEEFQRTLFHPFVSTKGDLGNGLGLYISKEIVDRHQGSIVIRSEAGVGTVAQARFPNR